MNRKRILQLILVVGIVAMCIPMLVCTLYTYPVQDDFYNTWNVGRTIQEGHTAFGAALLKALRGWKDYSGYYFSLFLTYFSDALVQCDIWTIRICQFVMALCFYTAVFIFIRTAVVRIFKYEDRKVLPVAFLFFVCITSLHYFMEHEGFLWFCASVIYLIPMTFILTGIVCMVYAIETGKKRYMALAMLLGFLAGGAVLNIAAFGCILYVMTAYWGIIRGQLKKSVCIGMPMLIGGMINVVAPGNFVRKGGLNSGEVWRTAGETVHYAWERIEMFLLQYPLFTAVIIILAVILLCSPSPKQKYRFYLPLLFTFLMFMEVCIVIYPVALGYGIDAYYGMDRSNFISDFVIFLNFFLVIFYWRGWLAVKLQSAYIKDKYRLAVNICMLVLFAVCLGVSAEKDRVSSLRIYRELFNGEISSYAHWNVSVIEAFEKALEESGENNVIAIYTNQMEDKTCLVSPKFGYGYYDPKEVFANTSMARFYGVDAVYIYVE